MSTVRLAGKEIYLLFNKLTTMESGTYRYWRVRILYSSLIAYAAFYLVRQNFSMAIPGIIEEYGYTKAQMGMIGTYFSIVYGVGKFINGYLSDRSNARHFLTIGLFGSAVISFFMGFVDGLWAFTLFWVMNAWFQSMGWPPAARMLTHWFSPKEIGTMWSLWASSHQIGAATIVVIAGYIIPIYGWRSAFYIPAVLALFFAFFAYNRLRDTPRDLGFPPVEQYKEDIDCEHPHHDDRINMREVLTLVLSNKLVWYVGIANLCLHIPRMGVFFWAPTFLKELKGFNLETAGWQVAGFEIAGLIGGIIAGWLSDKVFEGRRGPVGAVYLLLLAVSLYILWKLPSGHAWVYALGLMLAGFLVYGPQVLVGIAASDFASKRAVGVGTGVTGTLAYVGSAVSNGGIGYLVDYFGSWDIGFMVFIGSSLMGAFFFALTWTHRAKILDKKS
jgi:phosphoglycerate transporter family protein